MIEQKKIVVNSTIYRLMGQYIKGAMLEHIEELEIGFGIELCEHGTF